MFTVQQRNVPERLVLTERRRHVRQADLPAVNREVMTRLAKDAADYGGVEGQLFSIFFNEVYDENDIDFEVCVPIGGLPSGTAEPRVRVEPARREAYVRLKKTETFPPAVGEAYGAVAEWIGANGLTIAAAPREVYFTDFDSAGPDDEVIDVAFPVDSAT